MHEMLNDISRDPKFDDDHVDKTSLNDGANQVIFWGCKFKVEVIVSLVHIKCLNKIMDKAFNMLLDILRELVPNGNEELPNHFKL